MRILSLSDLHLEFARFSANRVKQTSMGYYVSRRPVNWVSAL